MDLLKIGFENMIELRQLIWDFHDCFYVGESWKFPPYFKGYQNNYFDIKFKYVITELVVLRDCDRTRNCGRFPLLASPGNAPKSTTGTPSSRRRRQDDACPLRRRRTFSVDQSDTEVCLSFECWPVIEISSLQWTGPKGYK